ncbi:MAG TPA: hypothetical protein VIM81_18535, partial [Gammaproteobacteria bacterium]
MNTETMDQRHSLLDQLRIDRGDDAGPGARFWPWVLGVTVLVAGITAAAWFLLTIPATVLVDVATAELVSADVPA